MTSLRVKIIGIILAILSVSMIASMYTAGKMLSEFEHFYSLKHETEVREQARFFIEELTAKYRDKLDRVLDKPLSLVGILSSRAAELYSNQSSYVDRGTDPKNRLDKQEENGIFNNGPTWRVNTLYWGGTEVSHAVSREHGVLSQLDGLLVDLEQADPSFTAAWLISSSGYGKYAPNIHVATLLPPPSEFDLRNLEDDPPYSLVSPALNPNRQKKFGDVYRDAVGHGLMVSALAPVYDAKGEFQAAVGIDISLKDMQKEILSFEWSISKRKLNGKKSSGFAFLVDQSGKPIAFPEKFLPLVGMSPDIDRLKVSFLQSDHQEVRETIGRMILGEKGIIQHTHNGSTHLLAFQPLQVTGWSLGLVIPELELLDAVKLSHSEMNQTVDLLLNQMGLITLVSILITLTLTYFFLQKMVLGPLRTIRNASRAFSQGELDSPVAITRNDEMGELAESFNFMRQSILKTVGALQKEERRLQAIINNSTAVIYLKDLHGHYLLVNNTFAKLFKADKKSIVGLGDADLFPKEIADKFKENDRKVVEGNRPLQLDEVVQQDDGIHNYISNKFPLYDENGKMEAICGISTDITDRKHHEEELEKHRNHLRLLVDEKTEKLIVAREEAEQASQAKSLFLANMSHEVRTPMNAVQGMVELLRRSELTNKQYAMLETISASSKDLLRLLDDILDLSKVEDGKLEIKKEDFNILHLLENLIELNRAEAKEKKLSLNLTMDETIPTVLHGDRFRLRQVLWNLIANAVKFTEKGFVAVKGQSMGIVPNGIRVKFSVEDSGVGISFENLAVIFDPFIQADSTKSRKHHGSGLGLAISKKLVDLMDGLMSVESQPNTGSVFHVELDFAEGNKQAQEKRDEKKLRPAPLSILLVEDELVSQAVVEALLTDEGYQVTVCSSGVEALELIYANPYDAVLMDLRMPEVDGIETSKRIRASSDLRVAHTTVIAFTGDVMKETVQHCFDVGMDGIIAKPIDIDEVNKVLSELVHSDDQLGLEPKVKR
ncbi:MAG: response regulator [Magnetococcales bacterium]|nr:response regulator [Magnetococcales bacterium]